MNFALLWLVTGLCLLLSLGLMVKGNAGLSVACLGLAVSSVGIIWWLE